MFNHVICSISLKVEEMARKLDSLLEGIEGEGGLRDASICAHRSSVLELEEGIESVSEKCRIWRVSFHIYSLSHLISGMMPCFLPILPILSGLLFFPVIPLYYFFHE